MSARPTRRKILFATALLTLPWIAGEVLISMLGWTPRLIDQSFFSHAPGVPYLFTPEFHFSGRNSTDEFDMDNRIGSHGFFDREWADVKPDHEARILFLGDSFTAGIPRKGGREYANEVERILKEAVGPDRVNVLNMGVGGYFATPERMVFEKYGLKRDPDAVVLNFITNDIIDMKRGVDSIALGPTNVLLAKHEAALGGFGTWLYLNSSFARWGLKVAVIDRLPHNVNDDDFDAVNLLSAGRYAPYWKKTFDEYIRIRVACDRIGIPMYLVHLCQPEQWTDDFIPVEEHLESFAMDNGIRFIRTRAAIADLASREEIYYPRDGHYRDNANIVISGIVAERLQKDLFADD